MMGTNMPERDGGSAASAAFSSPAAVSVLFAVGFSASVVGCGHAAVRRCWTGRCCRRHALEAVLFGALMPLALAGYWLVDARTDLVGGGSIWLLTPKVGRPNSGDASVVAEAAPIAGLSQTTTATVSKDWAATRLVAPKTPA